MRNTGKGFDVIHYRRALEIALDRWERRLNSWPSSFTLKRFNQPRLFTTNIGPSSSVNNNVQIIIRPKNILAKDVIFLCFSYCLFQYFVFFVKFPANVNKGCMTTDGVSSNHHTFQHLMRCFIHE